MKLVNGDEFCGPLNDNKPDGIGILTYKNRFQYKGIFVKGEAKYSCLITEDN